MFRLIPVLAVLAVFCLVVSPAVQAADETQQEGKLVKAGNEKLTMTDKNGNNERTHAVAENAKITLDGKAAKLEDLKAGYILKVTFDGKSKAATRIDAKKN